jgi:hypothetical protein
LPIRPASDHAIFASAHRRVRGDALLRFIENDQEELADYVRSQKEGLIVFDGRMGNGKTYLASEMAKRVEAYQSCAKRLGTRTQKAKMNIERKLKREAYQLSESIQATCQMLDSRTLPDASRKRLRGEVDMRTAARKSILSIFG